MGHTATAQEAQTIDKIMVSNANRFIIETIFKNYIPAESSPSSLFSPTKTKLDDSLRFVLENPSFPYNRGTLELTFRKHKETGETILCSILTLYYKKSSDGEDCGQQIYTWLEMDGSEFTPYYSMTV